MQDFRGGLLVISRDEHLVSSICEELWVAEPGRVTIFKAPFAEYRKQQLALAKKHGLQPLQPNGAATAKGPPKPPPPPAGASKR